MFEITSFNFWRIFSGSVENHSVILLTVLLTHTVKEFQKFCPHSLMLEIISLNFWRIVSGSFAKNSPTACIVSEHFCLKFSNASGIVLTKKSLIPCIAEPAAFFIFSHRLIQKFLNPSQLFHKLIKATINPAIAVTIKRIGFTLIVIFNAVIDFVIFFTAAVAN